MRELEVGQRGCDSIHIARVDSVNESQSSSELRGRHGLNFVEAERWLVGR